MSDSARMDDRETGARGEARARGESRFEAFRDFVDEADLAGNASRVARGFWPKMRRVARRVPFAEDAVAAWFCAMDAETPLRVRGLLLAALAYFIMPFDLVPDMLVGLGFTDDIAVLLAAFKAVQSNIRPEHYDKARETLNTL